MDTFNWIAALWTAIGGPAIGIWYGGNTRDVRLGWVVGIAATAVILLASFGLWKISGFPPVWGSFLDR